MPVLDPAFTFSGSAGHSSSPQSNTITTGLTALQFDSRAFQFGYAQNFLTGTGINVNWNNSWVKSNNPRLDLNPYWRPNMNLSISQKLLQGFGLAVNNRNIRVAKNNVKASDLTFKLQVMTTVSGIVNLYWDLVSYNEDFKVKQKALEVAQKFYEDNKKQVEIGTLAPIEIVRAEARVAQAQQELTNSETSLLQQESIVKNALSRSGLASPAVAEARVVPTDSLALPQADQLEPLADLTDRAIKNRPDIQQTVINLDNTKIGLAGSRSQLLPSLDIQGSFQNNSLAGSLNSLWNIPGAGPNADPFFIGGYGTALGQIFRRNFPDYSVGFQLNIPIRNRSAQADYVRDRLSLRQSELSAQRQVNELRVNVQNALTGVVAGSGALPGGGERAATTGADARCREQEIRAGRIDGLPGGADATRCRDSTGVGSGFAGGIFQVTGPVGSHDRADPWQVQRRSGRGSLREVIEADGPAGGEVGEPLEPAGDWEAGVLMGFSKG